MRNAYISTLYDLAKENKDILALISDNGAIVYDKYRKDFPEQYLNYGISEANMVASAAGLASCGKIPFAYTIGAFLAYRACEFIRNDMCLQNQNVKLVGIGAGMVYSSLGPTHHATEDMAILRALPNLTLFSPATPIETSRLTVEASKIQGPVYLRIGNSKEREIYDANYKIEIGKGVTIKEGTDITIIGTGSIVIDALSAAEELESEGISVRVINIHTIKPFDEEIVLKAARETKGIVTIEEHNITGGLGSAVAEILVEAGITTKVKRMGLKDFAVDYGSHSDIKESNGLGIKDIKSEVKNLLRISD